MSQQILKETCSKLATVRPSPNAEQNKTLQSKKRKRKKKRIKIKVSYLCRRMVWNNRVPPLFLLIALQQRLAIAERLADTKRSKTIDIRYNYVQQYIEEKIVELTYIETGEMVADTLTKPLSRDLFEKHRKRLLGNFQFMYSWLQSVG